MAYSAPSHNAVNFSVASGSYTAPAHNAVIFTWAVISTFTTAQTGTATYRQTFTGQQKGAATYRQTFATAQKGASIYRQTFAIQQKGSASAYTTWHGELLGTATLGKNTYLGALSGRVNLRQTYGIAQKGSANFRQTFTAKQTGTANFRQTFTGQQQGTATLIGIHRLALWGWNAQRQTFTAKQTGKTSLSQTFHGTQKGTATLYGPPFITALWGRMRYILTHHTALYGASRHAQAGLAGYTLYRGIDIAPDFTAPWQYSASLPFTTPALASGHTYQFVLRQRNQYGLESQNLNTWTLAVSSTGAATNAPAAPTGAALTQTAGLIPLLTATYLPGPDGAYAATGWLIYITTDGTTPNPATSSPVVVPMPSLGGLNQLRYTLAAQTAGTVIKALIRTRRPGTPNSDSTNTGILSLTLASTGPAAVHGSITQTPNLGDAF